LEGDSNSVYVQKRPKAGQGDSEHCNKWNRNGLGGRYRTFERVIVAQKTAAKLRSWLSLSQFLHAREFGIEKNTPVDISYRENEIVITPVKTVYRQVDLLAKVSSKNLHHEVEMNVPVGRELL
jgi:antitoxin component of MazEF toxin-antitoxin module